MAELNAGEVRIIEALARRFSAMWEPSEFPRSAWLTVGGQRIAVAIATLPEAEPRRADRPKARFRDDKVARRVLSDIEAAIETRASAGRTAILTLGAPIKLANRTVAAVTELLLERLGAGASGIDERHEILGNRVRFRIVDGDAWTSKLVGFVFSGDPNPVDVDEAMRTLRDAVSATAKASLQDSFDGERWLLLSDGDRFADAAVYRRALSRLSLPGDLAKILMTFDGGRIEDLSADDDRGADRLRQ